MNQPQESNPSPTARGDAPNPKLLPLDRAAALDQFGPICGVPAGFHRYEGLCIRPYGHDGPHSGVRHVESEQP